jgi:hypothetical protein
LQLGVSRGKACVTVRSSDCCILNSGGGAWAFDALATELSRALWVDISTTPRRFNYLLLADDSVVSTDLDLFVPVTAIEMAADKRAIARAFSAARVPTPVTSLVESVEDAKRMLASDPHRAWCLKYPTGCGATGHRMLNEDLTLPDGWPLPLVVQEFVPMVRPEVYRTYGAGGHVFGWIARRYPTGSTTSPWVAHVRGARYELAGEIPPAALRAATAALAATGLLNSFGCVDLIARPNGDWLVLEVGTDGLFNHVDRELGQPELELEIQRRIANAFWGKLGDWRPWDTTSWQPRPA